MIISHKHKFIFFAVPRTASHAIRLALRAHLSEDDEEHVHHFKPSRLNIEAFKDRKNGHFTVNEIKPHLTQDVWDSYLKFSFVRNPWDRFVSLCFFHYKGLQKNPELAKELMTKVAAQPILNQHNIFSPQTRFLYDSGNLAMDFVGKYENLQQDFNKLCDLLNITTSELQKINQSVHKSYLDYYDDAFRSEISQLYKSDIINFNYTFAY